MKRPRLSRPKTQSAIAIIPARGGSKGVVRKNLRTVGGRPLIEIAVDTYLRAQVFQDVVVSTDDDEIASVANGAGARVVYRSPELGSDDASSESVLIEALTREEVGAGSSLLAFGQCTSPFVRIDDLRSALAEVKSGRADVCFSACRSHDFLWSGDARDVRSVGHDPSRRLRRQDMLPQWRETGAFYVMRIDGLLTSKSRFFGHISVAEVEARFAIDIDDERDLDEANRLEKEWNRTEPHRPVLGDVEAIVFDFDGVQTNDRALVSDRGSETVVVNRQDGLGFSMLKRAGIRTLILSTESSPVVLHRARKLQVELIQSSTDKRKDLLSWCEQNELDLRTVAFVGNDINDLGAMTIVGWPIAVADAHAQVVSAARAVTERVGGDGVVREVAEWLCPPS